MTAQGQRRTFIAAATLVMGLGLTERLAWWAKQKAWPRAVAFLRTHLGDKR